MEEVKKIRKELKIKQIIFAGILKIDSANYTNIENGRLVPKNIKTIRKKALKALVPFIEKRKKELDKEYSELDHYLLFIEGETSSL